MVQREIETTKNKVGSNRRRSERSKAGNQAKRSGRSNRESMISRQRCAAAPLSSYERYYNGKALRRGDRVSDTLGISAATQYYYRSTLSDARGYASGNRSHMVVVDTVSSQG